MSLDQLLQDAVTTAPLTAVVLLSLIVILVNAFRKNSETLQFAISLAGIVVTIGLAAWTFPMRGLAYGGMLMTGGYSSLFSMLFLTAAALTIALGREYIAKLGAPFGEFYILILLAVVGMISFASGLDLMVSFLGLEILSVSLYVLAGFTRRAKTANEASLKYFLLGAFATGFFLYGIALIYGATGTTNILAIARDLTVHKGSALFLAGTGLLLVGFAFKVGAVPFHMWVPDVYEGAPTMVSAFMSTGAKAAAFAALTLVFTATFDFANSSINTVIAVLSVASMVIGNLVAISQSNIKRMLAYSSIAHAGYLLVGIAAGSDLAVAGVIYYLVSYTLTNIGAFGIVSLVENAEQKNVDIASFNGLGTRHPLLAVMMSVFLFSLVGIPPLSGFFGKYYVFVAAVEHGYTWLVIIGVITSMISVYYYLRVVVAMYFRDAEGTAQVRFGAGGYIPLALSAAGVLLIGLLPRLILDWMGQLF